MKYKIFGLILFSVFTMKFAANVFGQEPIDRAKEFRELQNKSQAILSSKSYRVTTTTEVFADKGASSKVKYISISESVPPDRRRYIFTLDKETTKSEVISIGEDVFIKDEKGKWKIDDTKSETYTGVGSSLPAKFIEKTSFAGQVVNIFEEQSRSFSEKGGDQEATTRYWFNSEGQLLKTESEKTDLKSKQVSHSVSLYEYDLNIKIEAPIIKSETKSNPKRLK